MRSTRALTAGVVVTVVLGVLSGASMTQAAVQPAKPSDFNGDGYPDLVVGAPWATIGGKASAGAAVIAFSTAAGPQVSKRQFLSRDLPTVPGASRAHDLFGFAVASGDFNGDGFADLAISTPYDAAPNGGYGECGRVSILFGDTSGVRSGHVIKEWGGDFSCYPGSFSSLVAADFDRDGYHDLVLTTPVIGNKAFWIPGGPGFANARGYEPRMLTRLDGGRTVYATPAAGDVNGDGYTDLVLSHETDRRWRTSLHLGGPEGLDPSPLHLLANGGPQVAVGNFDGDKYADVAVGSPLVTVGNRGSAGTVRIWHGGVHGIDTGRGSQTITQDTPGVPGSVQSYGGFGTALAAGDFNGDRRSDLAITAERNIYKGNAHVGYDSTVNVLFGTSAGIAPATGKAQVFSERTPGLPGADLHSAFGGTLSARDFNRDGRSELVVGSPQYNNSTGYVAVVPGTATGLKLTSTKGFFPKGLGVPAQYSSFGAGLER